MPFGYGQAHRTDHNSRNAFNLESGERVKAVLSSSMVAHTWAQGVQSHGRNGTGNFYFEGRALYSYGSHYVAGFLLPVPFTAGGAGAVLVNSESRSVTTSSHCSDARRAARGAQYTVPNLTRLADKLERYMRDASRLNPAAWPAEHGAIDPKALARAAKEPLLAWFSDPKNVASHDAVAAVFAAMSCKDSDKLAARARLAASRADKAAKDLAAKEAKQAGVAKAKAIETILPASLPARIKGDSIWQAMGRRGSVGYYSSDIVRDAFRLEHMTSLQWSSLALECHRAAKIAKASGQVARAAKVRKVRQVILQNLTTFEAAQARTDARQNWQAMADDLRKVVAPNFADARAKTSADMELKRRGDSYGVRTGPEYLAELLGNGAKAAKYLAGYVTAQRAATSVRVAGVVPADLSARLLTLAGVLEADKAKADKVGTRAQQRARVAQVRDVLELIRNPLSVVGTSAELSGRAARARSGAAVIKNLLPPDYAPTRITPLPVQLRLAGVTVAGVREFFTELQAGVHALESAERAARDIERAARIERDIAERAARDAERAARDEKARADWFQGVTGSVWRGSMPDGSAYLRTWPERDESGAITGGTLETSQGAEVPLLHALRAFQFLRLCRANGRAWETNGRAVKVGVFKLDWVKPDGSFKAGCHKVQWSEVERVAIALGVADLVPADVTESSHA